MKRILALLRSLAFQVCVFAALAWTWPVSGPVLDHSHSTAATRTPAVSIAAPTSAHPSTRTSSRPAERDDHVRREALPAAGSRSPSEPPTALRHARTPRLTCCRARCCRAGRCRRRDGRLDRSGRARRAARSLRRAHRLDEHGYVDPLAFLPGRPLHLQLSPPQVLPPKSGSKAASGDGSAKTATAGEKRAAPEPRAKGRAKRERRPAVHALTPRAPRKEAAVTESVGAGAKCSSAGGAVAAASGTHWCVRGRGERVGARCLGAPSAETWALLVVLFGAGVLAAGLRRRSPRRSRHTQRARGVRASRLVRRKAQDDSGRASMITSSWTEISSGSFSPRPMRFRISIGITMRPRSSTWRTMPVVFWWACEEAARNAARAPIVVVGRPSRLARFR